MAQINRNLLLIGCFLLAFAGIRAQSLAIKTNALFWGVAAPNASVEFKLANRFTADLQGVYDPLRFRETRNVKFWLAQPELRYWFCEAFEGHFVGVHVHGAQFYATGREYIYDGYLAGAGLTYGYNWILSPRWNLEALVGFGYARLWYKEMPDLPCMKCFERKLCHYIGPTKLAVSFSYLF